MRKKVTAAVSVTLCGALLWSVPAQAKCYTAVEYRPVCYTYYSSSCPLWGQWNFYYEIGTPDKPLTCLPVRPDKGETVVKPDTDQPNPPSADTAPALSVAEEILALVNAERAQAGLPALVLDEELTKAAQLKAEDMQKNNYFSHTSPTYGSLGDLLAKLGISYTAAGENIAMGYRDAQAVMQGWMNSPGHKANILNASYTKLGVGYTAEGNYWVQEFTD